jgi:Restriction endonuclease
LTNSSSDSPISRAVKNLEATEANLDKLDRLFEDLRSLVPKGIVFGTDPKYDELRRAYQDVLDALPTIDGWKPQATPVDLDDLAQWRFDAQDVGEPSMSIAAEKEIDAPLRELAEYRHSMNKKRRQIVRTAQLDAIARIDSLLFELARSYPESTPANADVSSPRFEDLQAVVQEIETMLGGAATRPPRWDDLRRHLSFGQIGDLRDIVRLDWPKVREGLIASLYGQDEPVPVEVSDLGELSELQPRGILSTKLHWDSLSAEEFERLLFALLVGARGYENPEWLTKTNAPDRGRDLSVTRVTHDQLAGTMRSRVVLQCKHWSSASVSVADVAELKQQMTLWDSPRVDVLVIATSGRFTSDAVAAIEKSNSEDRALRIEMWPESHLQRLLAERPALVAEFRLR